MTQTSGTVVAKRVDTPVEREEWFQGMVEEVKATVVESVFRSRWALIEGWHQVGVRIISEKENMVKAAVGEEGVVSRLAHAIGTSKRSLWRAVQFATRYPDLDRVPGGKNLSWSKVCNELLPAPKADKEKKAPAGEFDIVYADPDWGGTPDSDGSLSAERLASLKVPAAKDAVLFLWCPPSRLADAIDVLRAWGFQYRSHVAWRMGSERNGCQYTREIHETLLIGRRGDIGAPAQKDRPYSFYATDGLIKDEFRRFIEKMYPRGDRLGVFADARKDWTTWSVDDGEGKADTKGDQAGGRGKV